MSILLKQGSEIILREDASFNLIPDSTSDQTPSSIQASESFKAFKGGNSQKIILCFHGYTDRCHTV